MNILYTASATAQGGREGHVRSSDGVLDLDVSMPKAMGGSGRVATNPEQLFAAGYAACFENALIFIARQKKLALKDTAVTAEVGIGPREGGGFGLAVALKASLPGLDRAVAQQLLEEAHQVCPYSNAVRGNVEVSLALTEAG